MKCTIAKDMLPLYVDQLCSPETAKELEEHLASCEACRTQLAHYQEDLERGASVKPDTQAQLKPMQKIRRKMKKRTWLSVTLAAVLVAVFGCLGVLSYGEMTNKCISFTTISDMIRLRKVTHALAEGDAQPLMDVMAFTVQDAYAANKLPGAGDFAAYIEAVKADVLKDYDIYLAGRDVTVKLTECYQEPFDGTYFFGDDETKVVSNVYQTAYFYDFYEDDKCLMTMGFYKAGNALYYVDAHHQDAEGYNQIIMTDAVLPTDMLLPEIMVRYSTVNTYQAIQNGEEPKIVKAWRMCIKQADGETAYLDDLEALLDAGWIAKDVLYAQDSFDPEEGRWVYKLWFQFEELETGKLCMLEQKCSFAETHFYVQEDEPAVLLGTEGMSEDVQKKFLELFAK